MFIEDRVSPANMALAETEPGNRDHEGNGRLVTTLPPVHLARRIREDHPRLADSP